MKKLTLESKNILVICILIKNNMNYNIRYLPEAEYDLVLKLEFLEKQFVSQKVILDVYYSIKWTISSLDFMPERYAKIYKNYRRTLTKKYSIFYKINENKKEVIIYRILHQSQDFAKYLD